MNLPKSEYKNLAFFSGFSYFHQIASGSVTSHADGFGYQVVDGTVIPFPSSITQRPPYVEFYSEYPAGQYKLLGGEYNLQIGYDSNNIYMDGFNDRDPVGTTQFKIHYFIYDRAV